MNWDQQVVCWKKNLLLFTLREEHRLSVFEKRVLRKTLQPNRDEVTGEW